MPSHASQGAGAPSAMPAYITPEYLAEDRSYITHVVFIITASIVTVVMIARWYSRLALVKQFGLDDYLMTGAWCLNIVRMALSWMVVKYGAGRHIEYVMMNPDNFVLMLKYLYAAQLVYMVDLYLIRWSGLAFYHRINPSRNYTISLWVAWGFITAVFACQFFVILLQCNPPSKTWDLTGQVEGVCLSTKAVFITTAAMTIACDSIVLIMPMSIVWGLQTTMTRKIGLAVVLCFGIFAVITSIFRIVAMIPAINKSDATWYYANVLIWSEAETATAIVALCLPALKSLFIVITRNQSQKDSKYNDGSKSGSRDINLRTVGSGGGVYRGPNFHEGRSKVLSGRENSSEESLVYNSAGIAIKKTYDVDVHAVPGTPSR